MGDSTPRSRDVLLALALGSRRRRERRVLPDRRSGIDRRNRSVAVQYERRSGVDRRLVVRRQADRIEGGTLLEKARTRIRRLGNVSGERRGDGLR
jgi:hypothetical protein